MFGSNDLTRLPRLATLYKYRKSGLDIHFYSISFRLLSCYFGDFNQFNHDFRLIMQWVYMSIIMFLYVLVFLYVLNTFTLFISLFSLYLLRVIIVFFVIMTIFIRRIIISRLFKWMKRNESMLCFPLLFGLRASQQEPVCWVLVLFVVIVNHFLKLKFNK